MEIQGPGVYPKHGEMIGAGVEGGKYCVAGVWVVGVRLEGNRRVGDGDGEMGERVLSEMKGYVEV